MADFLWISVDVDPNSLPGPGSVKDKEVRSFIQRRASSSHGPRTDHVSRATQPPMESADTDSQPLRTSSILNKTTIVQTKTRHRTQQRKAPMIFTQPAMQNRWRVDPRFLLKQVVAKPKQSQRPNNDEPVSTLFDHCYIGSRDFYVKSKSFQRMISPKIDTCFGAGRVDPFMSIDSTKIPPYGHEVLDYAITTFWPSFFPTKKTTQLHPIKRAWLEACRKSPMVFFSFLFGAAENLLAHQSGSDSSSKNHYWRAKFHGLAIKYINEQISRLGVNEEPTDELLACILTLAVYGANSTATPDKSTSLLSAAQTLEVVARREHVKAHQDALYHLVHRKGGLSKVTMYGISVLIQATDILWSTLEQRPPALLWCQGMPTLMPFDTSHTGVQKLTSYVATGFSRLPNVDWPVDFTDIIRDICKLFITLYDAQLSGTIESRLEEFVAFRNFIQHRLISLPTAPTTTDSFWISGNESVSGYISSLEIIRLSLLILSTFVIFPVPLNSTLNRLLSRQLLAVLNLGFRQENGEIREPHLALLLWSAMLGAVNASSVHEKTSFTGFVRSAAEHLRIDLKGWDGAHEVLIKFLWWDDALEESAKSIWEDAGLSLRAGT